MIRRLVWPDAALYTEPLLAAVTNLRARFPGATINVGGDWASPKVLLTDSEVAAWAAPFGAWLAGELDVDPDKGITAWGLVVGRGGEIAKHKHEKSARWGINRYAGTYCVTCPTLSPGSSVLTAYGDDGPQHFTPTPGAAVAFDATTFHESAPHRELEPRIMIAFSVP